MKVTKYREVYVNDFANIPLLIWLRHQYISYFKETYDTLVDILKLNATIRDLLWFIVRVVFMPVSIIAITPMAISYRKKSGKEKFIGYTTGYYTFYGVDKKYIKNTKPYQWSE